MTGDRLREVHSRGRFIAVCICDNHIIIYKYDRTSLLRSPSGLSNSVPSNTSKVTVLAKLVYNILLYTEIMHPCLGVGYLI